MSLVLSHLPPKLCLRKPVLVRSSRLQTPPCRIIRAKPCGEDLGKLVIASAESKNTYLKKKVPLELMKEKEPIGSSHGWVATLNKEDGILRLQDDLNPFASDKDPKRIPLPPLVTLPDCQTQIITNVAMSSSSPEEDEDCVVAVKFLGPQISFCKPAQTNSKWINVKLENPTFFSSQVMFSMYEEKFRLLGSGGHLIRSWDLDTNSLKLQKLRYRKLPELTKAKRQLLESCYTREYLVESRDTGETFVVKWHRRISGITVDGIVKMKTQALMVFRLVDTGNAVYTQQIGDLCIFISKSEPFCVLASSFPDLLTPNTVQIFDVDEIGLVFLSDCDYLGRTCRTRNEAPYLIPPQYI